MYTVGMGNEVFIIVQKMANTIMSFVNRSANRVMVHTPYVCTVQPLALASVFCPYSLVNLLTSSTEVIYTIQMLYNVICTIIVVIPGLVSCAFSAIPFNSQFFSIVESNIKGTGRSSSSIYTCYKLE